MEVGEYDTLVGSKHHHHKGFFHRFKFAIIAFVVLVIALAIVLAVVLSSRGRDQTWDKQMNTDDVMGHMNQLQIIANNNAGTRAAGTSGYNASIAYILGQLAKTDYKVETQYFNFTTVNITSATNLTINSVPPFQLRLNYDYGVSGSGTQGTYNLENVNVTVAANLGCAVSDYDSVLPGTIALVMRGNCTIPEKAAAAMSKNPAAVIIYNDGVTPDRLGNFNITGGDTGVLVLTTGYFSGLQMMGPGVTVSVNVVAPLWYQQTMNIIADTLHGNQETTIVVGSHLDSVLAGPGINDNGSGSSLNIQLALMIASEDNQKKLKNRIRFCWFGAEELGLLGSNFYVSNLNSTNVTALREIAVNLNFDMIGSPNFIRGVYNGTSDKHNGSAVVQLLFNNYFTSQNLAFTPTPFTGRSDYGPFLAVGIPAGGLFTGAEEIKSTSQRTAFGGLAGAWLDPCYHQACDTYENINKEVVGDMSRAAAYTLEQLAIQTNLTTYLLHIPANANFTA